MPLHSRFIEADLGKTWRIILCPTVQGRQTDGWDGEKLGERLKRQYGACETGPNGGVGAVGGSAEGKDGERFVRLVSKTSCDKSSRVVSQSGVFVFDCVAIVSLREAAGQTTPRQEDAARGWTIWAVLETHTSEDLKIFFVSELYRLKRNSHSTGWKFNPIGQRLEREKLEWKHREQLWQVRAVRTTSRRRLGSQEEADTLSTGGTEMGGLKNAGNTMEETKEDYKNKSK